MLHIKKFNIKFFLMLVALLSSCIYSYSDDNVFTFLKSLEKGQNNVSGEYVMNNYLTGNEDDWIKSIDCQNINTHTTLNGILLSPQPGGESYSSLIINFNKNKLMRISKLIFYINKRDSKVPNVEVYLNGEKLSMNNMSFDPNKKAENAKNIQYTSSGLSSISNAWASSSSTINIPMKTLEIRNYNDATSSADLQLLGFLVRYEEIDITTGIEALKDKDLSNIEYFDLMGRKLASEPASGLFIVRNNGKTHKVLKP